MEPRLLILSDLFGGTPDWLKSYTDLLKSKFEIQYYDVLELANIDSDNFIESDIHNQFLNGGIDKAVENLLHLETEEATVLGFSIGGTIAWKASLKGLHIANLFTVSSTRLRYEFEVPNSVIKLYFGEKDPNKPNSKWFLNLNLESEILINQDHQLYMIENNVLLICDDIFKTLHQ
ncbi:alpha/beta hydrolase [Flavobacterium psychroterrae]|uniref:Alpha/beta hydrolase n=1 Tax=Flavobacterium psychroterrae TaxID=2133767 RepID=A0ABS5P6G4_9FLAO|nr:alpha/beta hydrolase [Flavobacterium psychroterrae]MBS7229897.1 alpha/beta hydrolase [Flavobacterium psychroterrae]